MDGPKEKKTLADWWKLFRLCPCRLEVHHRLDSASISAAAVAVVEMAFFESGGNLVEFASVTKSASLT